MSKLFSLKDKVAIVTGASRGIGECIAREFAAAGARVVISARKQPGLDEVAEKIRQAGGEVLPVAAHTGKLEDVQALMKATLARFGKVDILVNNAATNPYFGTLVETTDAAWDKTFEVNLKGYFMCAREVVRHLQERQAPGSIINVTSIAGLRSAALQGVYGMTKAAIISMTQTFAQELGGSNIRVNAIAPGLVETRFAATLVNDDALHTRMVERAALGRHAQPEELAGAAVFLASDASSYVTGHTLVVDGGSTITM